MDMLQKEAGRNGSVSFARSRFRGYDVGEKKAVRTTRVEENPAVKRITERYRRFRAASLLEDMGMMNSISTMPAKS